ncbi:double zinc ribbon domain-containing protein [Magnetospirillum aberrantis]|uniref:DZANK-type domain-containing protein n=1 Tax=Magnetospirillum aberrantis SpK TaxID=908842 RepID=A0A7C9UTE4_9PROT|nr:zinc ribbon domain-containing protein [Magnetospirillum aberrantis]NFV80027.1 hypothetical protein [Magnetospirillum aberrantis SpK]
MGWIVISWIVFAVVAGIAASARNRSVVGWVLLALLLSPLVALILLAFLPAVKVEEDAPGRFTACPECGALGPAKALKCGKCGAEFTAPPPPDTRACPFCAEEIKVAAIVCKHCGREVARPSLPGLEVSHLPLETYGASGRPEVR